MDTTYHTGLHSVFDSVIFLYSKVQHCQKKQQQRNLPQLFISKFIMGIGNTTLFISVGNSNILNHLSTDLEYLTLLK